MYGETGSMVYEGYLRLVNDSVTVARVAYVPFSRVFMFTRTRIKTTENGKTGYSKLLSRQQTRRVADATAIHFIVHVIRRVARFPRVYHHMAFVSIISISKSLRSRFRTISVFRQLAVPILIFRF